MIIATFGVGGGPGSSSTPAEDDDDSDADADADSDVVEVKGGDCVGYAYVGSHNFTPSAWGTLSGSGFTPVLNVSVPRLCVRSCGEPMLSFF